MHQCKIDPKPKSTIFNLVKFPRVCRLCLSPDCKQIISLHTPDPIFDGTICDFITAITFEISEDKTDLLPQMICIECLDLLKFFARYRNKVMITHLLMNSLVELKRSNSVPIIDLFNDKKEMLSALFKDLEMCNKDSVLVQDLLDEFSTYDIVSIPENASGETVMDSSIPDNAIGETLMDASIPEKAKGESLKDQGQISVGKLNLEQEVFFADECTPQELKDLNVPAKRINVKRSAKGFHEFEPPCANPEDPSILESVPIMVVKKYGGKKLEEPMQCPKCPFSTVYTLNFENHQELHLKRETRRYPCTEPGCSMVFQHRKLLQSHGKVAHKSLVCETCGRRCPTQYTLDIHMERHMKKFAHICSYCQKGYNTKHDMYNHIKQTHRAENNYACGTCGLAFKRKDIRDNHERNHTNVFDFPCNMCDKKFKAPKSLKSHQKVVHYMLKYECDHCDSSYGQRTKLLDHVERAHGIQSRFLCDICLQLFHDQEKLDTHKARHSNPQELECSICLGLFESTECKDKHMCITYRENYVCCERDHRSYSLYNRHMFTKHGVTTNVRVKPVTDQLLGVLRAKRKRFESCPKCETIFPTRTKKRQHMESCVGSKEAAPLEGSEMVENAE